MKKVIVAVIMMIMAGGAYARADILNPVGRSQWDIIEVKSSTEVKDVYVPDLALQWYCYEQMVDMGAASTDGTGATGRLTQWIDGNVMGDNANLWLRTTTNLKLQNLWLSLYHHDGTHSTVGELIDNVVVSTQRIGCGGAATLIPVNNVRTIQIIK